MVAEFKPRLGVTPKPRQYNGLYELFFLLSDSIKLRTRVLLGALVQILLCSVLPMRLAVAPACVMLLHSIITTIIQLGWPQSDYLQRGVLYGRTTSQLPAKDGSYGTEPADTSIVVFNLGIQYNHPLGVFSKDAMKISTYFQDMHAELLARREELGLLSTSMWRASEREANSSLMIVFYFKDVESIHKFAHEELHRAAWDYYIQEKIGHIGVFHETFVVPARHYETIYDNCRPVLMGTSASRLHGKDGDAAWAAPIVSADHPNLKTQYARLSRFEDGRVKG